MKKNIFIIAALALSLTACYNNPINQDDLFLTEEAAQKIIDQAGGRLLTLNELLDEFMTEKGNYLSDTSLYRTRATNGDGVYLFSIDTLPSTGTPLYIRGRVVTEDYAGNFYKSMVIQQIVDNKQQALRLSVDASNVSGQYAIGQMIQIRVNGLAIGRYANQPQLCVPSYNYNTYAQNFNQKIGWAPGRIPFARFQQATTRIGLPETDKIQCDTLSITDFQSLTTNDQFRKWDGKLVALKNVHFTGEYENLGALVACNTENPETNQYVNVFAPTTNNIGYPQGRVIADEANNVTLVSTSEYAKFARYYLPDDEYRGTVSGILGYYRDNARYATDKYDWSITIRGLKILNFGTIDDLLLYSTTDRSQWQPKEYGANK